MTVLSAIRTECFEILTHPVFVKAYGIEDHLKNAVMRVTFDEINYVSDCLGSVRWHTYITKTTEDPVLVHMASHLALVKAAPVDCE